MRILEIKVPLEKELKHVQKALELIEQYHFGVTLITKSDLILRDLELLKKINQQTKCVVQMTLTTFDENLCQKLEPGVCTTQRRIEVLKELHKNGIPTIVWLTPILPFINDSQENILKIDKRRANYYNYHASEKWGRTENYHLSIKSNAIGIDNCVDCIIDFVKHT